MIIIIIAMIHRWGHTIKVGLEDIHWVDGR